VTPGAVGQQVKALEDRLGVRLFERLHKQLVLTSAGQDYAVVLRDGFRRIVDATARLRPPGVATTLIVGVHARFDLGRIGTDGFRAANPTIGLRIMQPAGLHGLTDGKIDALIERSLGHHPGYRSDRLAGGSGVGDYLICPEGTAECPEITSLRVWLRDASAAGPTARFPHLASRGG
jgi:DNA-binding transcriptional LysR family regulator